MARSATHAPKAESRAREGERIPIEELSRRTGMTVRNLRALQAKSILPPPELVGRKGFYTERHIARVLLVLKLQSRRFSLAAIEALLKTWEAGSGLMDVMGLEDSLATPAAPVENVEAVVEEAFPELLQEPRILAKALTQELVVVRDGRIIAPNAELLEIVKQQVDAGYELEVVLDEGAELYAELERIATRFRESFFRNIVDRFMKPGSAVGVADVAEKVALLRPLSVRAVTILLARAIERGGGPPPIAAEPAVAAPLQPELPKKTEKPGRVKAAKKRAKR